MKVFSKVIQILIIVLIIGWLALVVIDFLAVKDNKDPKFCLSIKDIEYADNKTTNVCTGLGYKVYKYYENDKLTATEFGPFFIKDRNA